jgi:hypothetical protein
VNFEKCAQIISAIFFKEKMRPMAKHFAQKTKFRPARSHCCEMSGRPLADSAWKFKLVRIPADLSSRVCTQTSILDAEAKSWRRDSVTWDRCYKFENIFAKKDWRFFAQTTASFFAKI